MQSCDEALPILRSAGNGQLVKMLITIVQKHVVYFDQYFLTYMMLTYFDQYFLTNMISA